jgi:phosphoribosyl 1,2-cyclic phosphodiesterase
MKIKIWGTRGSIPVPGFNTIAYGGNTTCVALYPTEDIFKPLIIDAGTGIRLLGEELVKSKIPLDLDFIFTHSHWDHIQGFPFFIPAYFPQTTLKIFGCSHHNASLKESVFTQMDTRNFPVRFDELKANIEIHEICAETNIADFHLELLKLNHPGSGIGLKFLWNNKKLIFLTDHELSDTPYGGASLKETIAFCKGVDLLMHDAQFRREEIHRYQGWGHSAIEDVFELGLQAEVKNLILIHHNPNRTDSQLEIIEHELQEKVDKEDLPMSVIVGREGMVAEI